MPANTVHRVRIIGDTVKAIEVARRGLEIVPPEKLPYDFFVLGLGEVLIRAGNMEEGNRIISDVIAYSKGYLDHAVAMDPDRQFGMDYPIGINMQALLDINNMAIKLKMDDLVEKVSTDVNKYYSILYSDK